MSCEYQGRCNPQIALTRLDDTDGYSDITLISLWKALCQVSPGDQNECLAFKEFSQLPHGVRSSYDARHIPRR